MLYLQSQIRYNTIWPIRLVVRTPGFHPGNRSSILLWAAKVIK